MVLQQAHLSMVVMSCVHAMRQHTPSRGLAQPLVKPTPSNLEARTPVRVWQWELLGVDGDSGLLCVLQHLLAEDKVKYYSG